MIREVEASDLPAIAKLLKGLGYNTNLEALEKKTKDLQDDEEYRVLIDIEDESIVGLIALHTISLFHRDGKIGRITSFVVDESYRGNRAGKMLLEASDKFFQASGCTSIEAAGGMVNSHLRKQFLDTGYKSLDQHLIKTLRR
jgi:N-acetylglutamate synthase-like GNAT family acetyltransferase